MNNMLSVFPNYISTDSIFQKMVSLGAPWSTQVGKSMDISFFTVYSGFKFPSYFVSSNVSSTGTVNSQLIADVLWNMYGINWKHLWDDLNSNYNPLDNYNLKETVVRDETDNRDIQKDGSLSSSVNGTEGETHSSESTSTLQHGEMIDATRTVNDYTYGFNSTEQVPTGVQTSVGKDTHSGTDTTTNTDSGKSDLTSTQKRDDTTEETTKDDTTINENIERTRAGNIGQNSYQELLLKEFELWKWNFFWQVFDDCDKLLCLSVFDPCSVN